MSKNVTLQDLANEFYEDISTSTKVVRKTTYNKKIHTLRVSIDLIKEQVLPQLKGVSFDPIKVDEAIAKCVTSIYSNAEAKIAEQNSQSLETRYKTGFTFILKNPGENLSRATNNQDFEVIVASNTGKGSAFDQTNKLKASSEATLSKTLEKLTGVTVKFDLGHEKSVAEHHRDEAIARFFGGIKQAKIRVPKAIREKLSYKILYEVNVEAVKTKKATSKYIAKLTRKFPELAEVVRRNPGMTDLMISTIAEDWASNQGKGASSEQKFINAARRAAKDVTNRINIIKVTSSPSDLDRVISVLVNTSLDSGARLGKGTKKPAKIQNYSKKANKSEEKERTISLIANGTASSVVSPKIKTKAATRSSSTNWSSLIAIINEKLPERVARNMSGPGLVFRTGRFAESTKVVNVQTTKEGYPSIVFDYQRDPYDVFDKTLGRSPWNTPARDPRALVDRSVREIVQEMAIGRFYTRRA